jgi:hypothetical protein
MNVLEEELLHIEIEREGYDEIIEIELHRDIDMVAHVRRHLELDIDVHIFERDRDEPLARNIEGRRHLRLIAHPHRLIDVVVRYEHQQKEDRFPPSATVFTVLKWAVGKHGYRLDPQNAARANLILPGAEQPLPRDRAIGAFTKPGAPCLVVDLTLKGFTNGRN